jgi:phosphatidylserine/phosphatidylglycerophosphate/cardiolipin synthase-like enzyme
VEQLLEQYGAGDRVRIAASHIRNPGSVACLQRLAWRGAQVEIAAEHSARRVPRRMERRLHAAGIKFMRLGADSNVPMHLKFVLAEGREGRQAVFGSFNWTLPSYMLNHELAVITRDEAVFAALDGRWRTLGLSSGTPPAIVGKSHD